MFLILNGFIRNWRFYQILAHQVRILACNFRIRKPLMLRPGAPQAAKMQKSRPEFEPVCLGNDANEF
jgi:hypothetical protein